MQHGQHRGCVDGESGRDAKTNPNHAPTLLVSSPKALAAHLNQASAVLSPSRKKGRLPSRRDDLEIALPCFLPRPDQLAALSGPLSSRPCLLLPKRDKKAC